MSGLNMQILLKTLVEKGGSDLHIMAGAPPVCRINGDMIPLGSAGLSAADVKTLAYSVINVNQKKTFEEDLELDFSFAVEGLGRFRGNLLVQRGTVSGVFRSIPFRIPTFEELGIPRSVGGLLEKPGLVLVTGPTGSGKSTTLASMIDRINAENSLHIVTVEDPIEYVYANKKSVVKQREVGIDTLSFKKALAHVLRQDPDIILIGEMRDLDTVAAALNIAETGHLAFATLHTRSSIESINRVIDVFPANQQSQVRTQLSFVLKGVLSQQLIPSKAGGRVLAMEQMYPNEAIRNLIREDKLHQVYSLMQSGQDKSGMKTMNQALTELVQRGIIAADVAIMKSQNSEELQSMLARIRK